MTARRFRVLRPGDDDFPSALDDAVPRVASLWHLGHPLRALGPRVAVVGTRTPTPYGVEVARSLARGLALAGICVVSGMARGVDTAAHEGALEAEGATLAVLGSGIDRPFPRSNAALCERISAAGAVVSEYAPGTPAYPGNFRMRNRIIAALSLGVVVVQAEEPTSGALITARLANDLHRELFAVPGDIRSSCSSGPNGLLRAGMAHVCCGPGDVLAVLAPELERCLARSKHNAGRGLRDEERRAVEALARAPARADAIAAAAAIEIGEAVRVLTRLELRGLVRREAGGLYRLLR